MPKSVLVLRNLDITLSGIENSHRTGGEMEFGVKAKLLQDLDKNAADVSFYRQNDAWSKLPTKHMGQAVGIEDEWYIHYLGEILGFSVFAVDVKIEGH